MGAIGPLSGSATAIDLWIGSMDPRFATIAAVPTQNAANLYAFQVARPVTVTTGTIAVGVANGNVDIGIYSGPVGGTGTRIASTGSTVVVGTAAAQTIAFTAPVALVPGVRYWAAVACDGATVQLYGFSSAAVSNLALASRVQGAAFPLPATVSLAAGATSRFHAITFA